jgi:hypothetical protein
LKLLQELIEKILENIAKGNYFLNRTPITQEIRARIDKYNGIKLKGFCIPQNNFQNQETIHRWEKIFANYPLDKELITRIYKKHQKIKLKEYIVQGIKQTVLKKESQMTH